MGRTESSRTRNMGYPSTLIAVGALLSCCAGVVYGFEVAPDQKHVLISKEVDGNQWAITYDVDDRTATAIVSGNGNVDPVYFACNQISEMQSRSDFLAKRRLRHPPNGSLSTP